MNKILSSLLLCTILPVMATTGLMAAVKNGEAAPDFTLETADGKPITLSENKGKWVVLEWVNPGCPFVKKFYDSGEMQKLQKRAGDQDVVWLTINSTSESSRDYMTAEQTKAYIKDKEVVSSWLMDANGKVGKAYGASNTPHMFVINPDGEVVYQGAIDSIRSADTQDIAKAENYVLAALRAGMNGDEIELAQTRPYGCSVKY